MKSTIFFLLICMAPFVSMAFAQQKFEIDTIKTNAGNLAITFIGHGTLMFQFNDKIIHVDPVGSMADYSTLPQADLILVTHEHYDHLDATAIKKISKGTTVLVASAACVEQVPDCVIMKNGDVKTVAGFHVEAVPAYNIQHKRPNGNPFHQRGVGNGYIITYGDKRIYVAGDTENTPEMKQLKNIDIAFLPMNLPYTMTPEMVADAAQAFKPKILYPYHYGDTDTNKLLVLLQGNKEIEVRIRKMQ